MTLTADGSANEFVQFYGPEAWTDWLRLQAHFDLGSGFAFLILFLPGAVGAEICRRQLKQHLETKGKRLVELPCEWPEDARRLRQRLFEVPADENLGGIWLGTVIPESDPEIDRWKEAWRNGLASLNEQRNPLRTQINCPLVLVGAPWLQVLLRETAPDLWSVRTGVVAVTPAMETKLPFSIEPPLPESEIMQVLAGEAAADPDYALEQAERLRGRSGLESARAYLLLRAGNSFNEHSRFPSAERCYREAAQIFATMPEDNLDAQATRGGILNNLANTLSALGHYEEALKSAEESLQIRRRLTSKHSDSFLPDLAASLNTVSSILSELGRAEESLSSAQEALKIRQQLAEANPDAYLPDLAISLNNMANRLSTFGRSEEALNSAQAAVQIYQQLALTNPDTFLPRLAISLNTLSNRQSDLGKREEALVNTQRAVQICKELAESTPDTFLSDYARFLNNLANRLSELGRLEEALERTLEGLRIYEQLAQTNRERVLPDLASSLINVALTQSRMGDAQGALTHIQEAVQIFRQLAKVRPSAYLPRLANSLNNLAVILNGVGLNEEALDKARESVSINQFLAEANPGAYLPSLASSLINMANRLSKMGQDEEALANARRAVEINEKLAHTTPDAFSSDLAISCGAQGAILTRMGLHEEAAASFGAGLRALTSIYSKTPSAFESLVNSLRRDYLKASQKAKIDPDRTLVTPGQEVLQETSRSDIGSTASQPSKSTPP